MEAPENSREMAIWKRAHPPTPEPEPEVAEEEGEDNNEEGDETQGQGSYPENPDEALEVSKDT